MGDVRLETARWLLGYVDWDGLGEGRKDFVTLTLPNREDGIEPGPRQWRRSVGPWFTKGLCGFLATEASNGSWQRRWNWHAHGLVAHDGQRDLAVHWQKVTGGWAHVSQLASVDSEAAASAYSVKAAEYGSKWQGGAHSAPMWILDRGREIEL